MTQVTFKIKDMCNKYIGMCNKFFVLEIEISRSKNSQSKCNIIMGKKQGDSNTRRMDFKTAKNVLKSMENFCLKNC